MQLWISRFLLDPHRDHCTAITKRLKLYVRGVTRWPSHYAQKVPCSFTKIGGGGGEILHHKHYSQITCSSWIDVKCSCKWCVINHLVHCFWPMIAATVAASRMNTPEGLSVQSVPVSPLRCFFVGLLQLLKIEATLYFGKKKKKKPFSLLRFPFTQMQKSKGKPLQNSRFL